MKKLFLLVLLLMIGFTSIACNDDTDDSGYLTILVGEGEDQTSYEVGFDLEDKVPLIDLLEVHLDVSVEASAFGPYLKAIDHLEEASGYFIGVYHNEAFASEGVGTTNYEDGDEFLFVLEKIMASLKIEISDGYTTEEHWILFDDEETVSLKVLLEENLTIDYEDSEWGSMLVGIEAVTTQDGNFIAINHNGAFAMEGIDTTDFVNGDTFRFELTWWDLNLYGDYIIEQFLENHAQNYVDMGSIYVISALYHLGVLADFDLEMIDIDIDEATGGELVQAIMIGSLLEVDISDYNEALIDIVSTDFLFSAALFNMVLDDSATHDAFITAVEQKNVSGLDSDTLNMIMLALAKLDQVSMIEPVHEAMIANLYTGSYGINAANLAMAVIGISGAGFNADSLRYNFEEDLSVFEFLLKHHAGDGSFYYQLDDDAADLGFSTPQAFLALVLYTSEETIHPFILD